MATYHLNAKNLLCPLPVIRVQDAMARLAPGDCLAVECTDPGALHDIPAWCKIHGHCVVTTQRSGRLIQLQLQAGAPDA